MKSCEIRRDSIFSGFPPSLSNLEYDDVTIFTVSFYVSAVELFPCRRRERKKEGKRERKKKREEIEIRGNREGKKEE